MRGVLLLVVIKVNCKDKCEKKLGDVLDGCFFDCDIFIMGLLEINGYKS